MAPIIDKRPQSLSQTKEQLHTHTQITSHVHNPNSAHISLGQHHAGQDLSQIQNQAKENISRQKKGLQILDFHESWLEEVELYRGKGVIRKNMHYPLLPAQQNRPASPQGEKQSINKSNIVITNYHNNISAKINNAIWNTSGIAESAKQKPDLHLMKQRVMLRDSAVAAATQAAAMLSAEGSKSGQGNKGNVNPNLKRAREEHSSGKNTNHSKRPAQSHSHLNSNQQTHGHPNTVLSQGQSSAKSSNSNANPSNASTLSKSPGKIVVNQFHAVNMLNSHHNDEKTKILTQNGLTKSAATAYETSMYASHYLPQEGRAGNSVFNSARLVSADGTNYIGVSLAKHEKTKELLHEEDPCAAIDDVNDYTDSDTDEEYIGNPFFLEEDGEETHQSQNIRPNLESDKGSSEEDAATVTYYTPKAILTPSLFPNVPPYLNFSSHVTKGPPMPAALHRVLKWKLSPVMPKIVKRVVLNSGFRIIRNTTDWMAIWEKHMKSPGFRTIRSHQKYNHMPGSFRIGRKDTMWRGIQNNIKKFGSKEFGFMQKSYIMPDDLENLRLAWPKNASKLTKWIVKPPASARGTGIRIVNKWSQFPKDRPLVVQKYIERPLLINDNKFDMRLYVALTSINPLRIYMYKDGLARFASVKYSPELNCLDERCMHLTNYSINKYSQNYSKNEDFNACQGHKWTLQSLWSCLENRGVNTKRLWATLRNLVIRSIISGESGLNRMYRQNVNFRYNCFELFGFDVLLDENIVPWLLEINISPSLHSELPLDLHVKGPLIQAVLNTALYQVPPKFNETQQKDILEELNLKGPLCHDKRIFSTCLTAEEVRKHNMFTNRTIEFREEYLDTILDHLLPDDIRCLIIAEDELARCKPLERIFPTPDTHCYLKYIDNPRYYNRLLDAWEHKYGHRRELGIAIISRYCEDGYHLQVSDAALQKEPDVAYTEIDMLHTKRSDDVVAPVDVNPGDNATPKPETIDGNSNWNASNKTPKTALLLGQATKI